ncbi:MAG: GNAT family N-acetyltransferase [Sphaerochaetaceae bacterium]|nr:GNAT family N-acetyltransferase [Spirochaetales bacterium]MDY5500005.1 GNAT family N-acetyltransferase [Sphaerochaetaceae bacterium]
MDITWVSTDQDREARDRLLARAGLAADGDVTRSVLLYDGDMAVGTASRKDNVLKWFAINPSYQGQGLVGVLLTPLVTDAIASGISRLFFVTKPGNVVLFRSFGFFLIAETSRMALMENRKDGLSSKWSLRLLS